MKTLNVTEFIIDELDKNYDDAFKIDFENHNLLSLHLRSRGILYFGELYFSLEVTQSHLVCGIDIYGPGFVAFDKRGYEVECIYNKKKIRSYIENVLYGYLSRDYDANYYNEDY